MDTVEKILAKRRDRMIATILGVKEDECDQFLPVEASTQLRKVVLDQVNDYFDLCRDLLRSIQPDTIILNETYAEKLDEIHEALTKNA